ncbi:MAG TPA: hypothetical protein VGG28_33555 [Kofleriaceae bacterium]|jgi:hypothetical protein
MKRAFLIVLAAGCAVQSPPPATDTMTTEPTFTQDTYYTGIVPPYATPEECEASDPNPIECHLELGFCAGGLAGFSNFDLPEQGNYHLEGAIIVASFDDHVIQLDPQTGHATNAQVDTYVLDTIGRWDTLQFDAGVTCAD